MNAAFLEHSLCPFSVIRYTQSPCSLGNRTVPVYCWHTVKSNLLKSASLFCISSTRRQWNLSLQSVGILLTKPTWKNRKHLLLNAFVLHGLKAQVCFLLLFFCEAMAQLSPSEPRYQANRKKNPEIKIFPAVLFGVFFALRPKSKPHLKRICSVGLGCSLWWGVLLSPKSGCASSSPWKLGAAEVHLDFLLYLLACQLLSGSYVHFIS